MSSLNLQPSLPIIVVQVGVFLANMYAVKKLMLEPYLKVHAKRQSLTAGATDAAKGLNTANEDATQTISKRLADASTKAQQQQLAINNEATREKDAILAQAEKAGRDSLGTVQDQVRKELEEQRREIPRIVALLADEAFQQVIA